MYPRVAGSVQSRTQGDGGGTSARGSGQGTDSHKAQELLRLTDGRPGRQGCPAARSFRVGDEMLAGGSAVNGGE